MFDMRIKPKILILCGLVNSNKAKSFIRVILFYTDVFISNFFPLLVFHVELIFVQREVIFRDSLQSPDLLRKNMLPVVKAKQPELLELLQVCKENVCLLLIYGPTYVGAY